MKKHLILLTSALALALTSGCGGDSTGTPNNGGNQNVTADAVVNVRDDVFDPTSVTINKGQTVGWQWRGAGLHNVIFTSGGISTSSPAQTTGTFTQVFANAGTYNYYCSLHGTPTSGMRGTVVVN